MNDKNESEKGSDDLKTCMDEIGKRAAERGLTPEKLETILNRSTEKDG